MDQTKAMPERDQGRIYDWVPRTLVRVTGQTPLAATVYRLEQMRCRLCDAVFACMHSTTSAPRYASAPLRPCPLRRRVTTATDVDAGASPPAVGSSAA